ncbi:hypothetical protein IHV09_21960 [Fictibacillus sp. 23RED33]|nr:hypothetical protein [Fictibacillus sp. 23RED33]MBH0176225.1 hypothetical protein [Fictibacillus sp. 23RED33]
MSILVRSSKVKKSRWFQCDETQAIKKIKRRSKNKIAKQSRKKNTKK